MHFSLYFVCIITTVCIASSHDDNIYAIKYTADNFNEVYQIDHFIMFYAPWCGHCQKLAPIWEQLAELNPNTDLIKIGKIDCTTETDICSENNVTGYPTLKFFKTGVSEGERYHGTRDLESLVAFVSEKIEELKSSASNDEEQEPQNISDEILDDSEQDKNSTADIEEDDEERNKPPEEVYEGLFELNQYNFVDHVANGTYFVKFYSSYCSYCLLMEPAWKDLAKTFKDEDIGIARLNCIKNKKFCTRNGIKGYPTLLWFVDGEVLHENFNDESYEELKAYVDKMQTLTKEEISELVEKDNAARLAAYEEAKKAYEEEEAAKKAAKEEAAAQAAAAAGDEQDETGSGQETGEASEDKAEATEETITSKIKLDHGEL